MKLVVNQRVLQPDEQPDLMEGQVVGLTPIELSRKHLWEVWQQLQEQSYSRHSRGILSAITKNVVHKAQPPGLITIKKHFQARHFKNVRDNKDLRELLQAPTTKTKCKSLATMNKYKTADTTPSNHVPLALLYCMIQKATKASMALN